MAKWLEAACYVLTKYPDAALHRLAEEAVDDIRGAQQEDGYINSYYTVSKLSFKQLGQSSLIYDTKVVEPELKWANIAYVQLLISISSL